MLDLNLNQKELIKDYIIKPFTDRTRPSREQVSQLIQAIDDTNLLTKALDHINTVENNNLINRSSIKHALGIGVRNVFYLILAASVGFAAQYSYHALVSQGKVAPEKMYMSPQEVGFLVAFLAFVLTRHAFTDAEKELRRTPMELKSQENRVKSLRNAVQVKILDLAISQKAENTTKFKPLS